MRLIRRIRAWFRKKRAERKLEKSGYKTWAVYRHYRDPDLNRYQTRIKDFYEGYKFVYCIEDRKHYAYQILYDYGPGGIRWGEEDIYDWLDQKARFKSRMDTHRVIRYPSTANEWEFNDMGGGDYIFVAFKDEKDYMMFLLRWS